MPDFKALIDRTLRDWLNRPGERPVVAQVGTGGAADTATTIPVDTTLLLPEEEALLGAGQLVEVSDGTSSELILAGGWDGSDITGAVRGYQGTTALTLNEGDEITLAPKVTRNAVYSALADQIENISPPLFTVDTISAFSVPTTFHSAPADLITVQEVVYKSGSNYFSGPIQVKHNFPPADNDIALFFPAIRSGVTAYVTYRKSTTRPTDETTTYADMGIQTDWDIALIIGAIAQLITQDALDDTTTEYLTQQLEANQGGDEVRLAAYYARWHDREVQKALRRLSKKYDMVQKDTNGVILP